MPLYTHKIAGSLWSSRFYWCAGRYSRCWYLCLTVYKMPELCKLVIDTGIELVKTGKAKVEAFNEIANAIPQN